VEKWAFRANRERVHVFGSEFGQTLLRLDKTRELCPLLAQNKFSAVVRFNDLLTAVAGTELEQAIEEVKWLIDEFQFQQALERLRTIDTVKNLEGKRHE
jgi:hypothetical protein